MAKKVVPEYLTENDDGSVTVTLSRPISIAGSEVGALRVREPSVEDLLRSSKATGSDEEKEIHTFADLCEITPQDIKQLKYRDYTRLQKAYGLFTD